jgi:hypothetical protein
MPLKDPERRTGERDEKEMEGRGWGKREEPVWERAGVMRKVRKRRRREGEEGGIEDYFLMIFN